MIVGTGYSEARIRRMPYLSQDDEVYALIQKHGAAFGYHYTWSPALGARQTVIGRYYVSSDEAAAAFARSLFLSGYTVPRWWQFWRWGEAKLPESVAHRLRTETAGIDSDQRERKLDKSGIQYEQNGG